MKNKILFGLLCIFSIVLILDCQTTTTTTTTRNTTRTSTTRITQTRTTQTRTTPKSWLKNCNNEKCIIVFERCRKCNGDVQCAKCLREASFVCLQCSIDIYDENSLTDLSGTKYLICNNTIPVHTSVCHFYCRGQYKTTGSCQIANGNSICVCS